MSYNLYIKNSIILTLIKPTIYKALKYVHFEPVFQKENLLKIILFSSSFSKNYNNQNSFDYLLLFRSSTSLFVLSYQQNTIEKLT